MPNIGRRSMPQLVRPERHRCIQPPPEAQQEGRSPRRNGSAPLADYCTLASRRSKARSPLAELQRTTRHSHSRRRPSPGLARVRAIRRIAATLSCGASLQRQDRCRSLKRSPHRAQDMASPEAGSSRPCWQETIRRIGGYHYDTAILMKGREGVKRTGRDELCWNP